MKPDSEKPASPSPTSSILWRLRIGPTEHKGEVIVADGWSPQLGQGPEDEAIEFRIVVLNTPSRIRAGSIKDSRTAVWLPSRAVSEEQAVYQAHDRKTDLAALLNSVPYLQGRIYTSRGLAFRQANELVSDERSVALDSLGAFVLLSRAEGYLRLLAGDLPPLTDLSALESNLGLYQQSQEVFRGQVEGVAATLETLAQGLDSALSDADQQAQDNLRRLAGIGDPVLFGRVAEELYGGPSGLARDLEALTRLRQLAEIAGEIQSMTAYLGQVSLRSGDDELMVDLMSIRGQLQMDELAARPHLWDSVRDIFRWFKARYVPLYQEHHRRFYLELQDAYYALSNAGPRVDAVGKLNTIPELRDDRVGQLTSRYEETLALVKPCKVRDVSEATLALQPACPECRLPLSSNPPTREAREYLDGLQGTLEKQCRRLSMVTTRRILRTGSSDKLDKLIRVVQLSDLTSLVNVLDDELVHLLTGLLREQPD